MHTGSENPLNKYICFLLLSVCFVMMRMSSYAYVYMPDGLRLIDPDSYYHLRRTLYAIQNFPGMLSFDSFLSYPAGDYVPWPPFYDFFSALLLKPFGNPLAALPFLNMLYFYAAFTLIYFYIARKNGLPAAVITGMVLSYAGILTVYSSFGRFDHHAMEMLLATLFYISFMEYYDKKKTTVLLVMSLTTVAAFFNWSGAIIYFVPLFVFIALGMWRNSIDRAVFKGLFVAFHLTAISIAIYVRLTKTDAFPPYSYVYLSGFHRDFCFLISGLFGAAYFVRERKINKLIFWMSVCALSTIFFHNVFLELIRGLGYLSKKAGSIVLVEEIAPLFFSSHYPLGIEIERNLSLFSPLLFLFPLIAWLYWKKKGRLEISLFTLFFFIITVNQLRFGIFFMTGFAIMTGVAFGYNFKKVTGYALLAAFLLLSGYSAYRDSRTAESRFVSSHILEAMRFVRERTPLKEEFIAYRTPYGVLSSWDLGHYLIQAGNRPSVDNTFLTLTLNASKLRFPEALFSPDETGIVRVMDESRARFLVMENPYANLVTDWPLFSDKPNPFVLDINTALRDPLRSYLYRLYSVDGMLPSFEGSPEHLRLVFELPANRANYGIKIFERVSGARIVAPAGGAILKARIRTNRGREFMYVSLGRQTAAGREFVMPYSTSGQRYDTKAAEIAVELAGKKIPLSLRDEDVAEGSVIRLP